MDQERPDERGASGSVRRAEPPAPPEADTWWVAPAAAIAVVVCCVGPLLLVALVATGASGWLAGHELVLSAAALLTVAAIFALRAWRRVLRR